MTEDEALAIVNSTNETLVKVGNEVDGLMAANAKLQKDLADAIAAGANIPPALEASIKAVDTRVNAIHEVLPDVPNPE